MSTQEAANSLLLKNTCHINQHYDLEVTIEKWVYLIKTLVYSTYTSIIITNTLSTSEPESESDDEMNSFDLGISLICL